MNFNHQLPAACRGRFSNGERHLIHRSTQFMALLGVLLLATLALTACGGHENVKGEGNMPGAGMSGNNAGNVRSIEKGRNINVRGLKGIPRKDRSMFTNPNNPLSTRTIYFSFDSSAIKSKFSRAIQAHAQYLSNHPGVHLRLEGHTDKRGTREYNIALGERRAKSVEQALELDGAGDDQISTLSFGEEKPAVTGDTAAAYAKNRRVVLIYTK